MAWFMFQASYTPEAWANQIKDPKDRISALKEMFKPTGMIIHHAWYSFGEYDLLLLVESPGNIETAGAALAAAAGGALKASKTTPLLTPDEAIEAMKIAEKVAYRQPGQ